MPWENVKASTPESVLLCNVPCEDGEYYRQESGECVTHCSFPLTIRYSGLLTICENVPSNTGSSSGSNSTIWTSLADKLEQLLESFSAFATAANAASSIFRPNSQNSVFMISLAKSAKHVNFIDLSIYSGDSSRLLVETGDSSGFAISKIFTFNDVRTGKKAKKRFLRHGYFALYFYFLYLRTKDMNTDISKNP